METWRKKLAARSSGRCSNASPPAHATHGHLRPLHEPVVRAEIKKAGATRLDGAEKLRLEVRGGSRCCSARFCPLTSVLSYCLLSQATEFTRQLAVYMAKLNRTKLPQRNSSTLFAFDARSSYDVFFSDDPVETAVRAAVPIKISGGFLTFNHKTIMEHSVAVAVVEGVKKAILASGMSPEQIIEVRAFALYLHVAASSPNTTVTHT